ncbi:hypothetical protein [Microbacterium sp. PAMC22086]|uniref:hypothetical protein n=1 Tax=Microbacterium sp. PAMC22086 TaxID=2861281 RepID=UPI001C63AE8E|nr:hypothetical protein [Microbacterium sp. PAMC22086]QYG10873.1 hypothetical protein KY497_11245 [Microbacterium sp. PAMC22086]
MEIQMSRRVDLPTAEQVRAAIRELSTHSPESVLTVRALAQHLGLANSTFWRHFGDVAQSVADNRRSTLRTDTKPVPATAGRKDDTEVRLRGEIERLKSQVALAAAQVQRLTLENHALRQHLEAENTIVRIPRNR